MDDRLRAVSCVNACQGMADPAAEIEAMRAEREEMRKALETFWEALPERLRQEEKNKVMREAIREAHESIQFLCQAASGGMQPANAKIDAIRQGNASLAKLQPFLP